MPSDHSPQHTLAIRPPEYLPRCSFMALLDYVDEFVLADTFSYSRQSHHNRAPIRTPSGRMWLSLPLEKGSRAKPIAEVRMFEDHFWPGKHWRALQYNYSQSPFFAYYADELKALLYAGWDSLGQLSCESVSMLARWMRVGTPLHLLSKLDPPAETLNEAAEGRDEAAFVSAAEAAAHDAERVRVHQVVEWRDEPYTQHFDSFEPNLSALDLVFNWGPEALSMLRSRRQVRAVDQADVKPP